MDPTIPPPPAQDSAITPETPDTLPWQDVDQGASPLGNDPGVKRALEVFPGKVRKPKKE